MEYPPVAEPLEDVPAVPVVLADGPLIHANEVAPAVHGDRPGDLPAGLGDPVRRYAPVDTDRRNSSREAWRPEVSARPRVTRMSQRWLAQILHRDERTVRQSMNRPCHSSIQGMRRQTIEIKSGV